jgi:2-amino-4-hydroxy-6-hydroxymethyldihydropteridine diphosphokinase
MSIVFIALGSNLGDRRIHLRGAMSKMNDLPDTRIIAQSKVYETAPVAAPDSTEEQGPYLNAVVQLDTSLTPEDLLAALREIEMRHGRVRREKWGQRTLDLDILLYDDRIIDEPGLTVPHPRMHERWFVLKPLCDIAADAVHPQLNQPMSELLAALGENGSTGRKPGA